MNFKYIATAFKAEWLKIKGLGLLYTGIAIAAIAPLLVIIMSFIKEPKSHSGFPMSIYNDLIESFYGAFGGFFLLIFIIIAASRIAQSDHGNNGWTFMETQPLSKLSIYTGKFLSVLVLSTITILLFYVFTILSGTLIQLVFPSEGYTLGLDFGYLFHSFIRLWVMSLGIISIQMMLSMVFSGFIWPFIIGFLGFVLNVVAQIRGEVYNFVIYNNVSVGTSINDPNQLNSYFNYTEYLSFFWTVVFFVIGYVIYSHKGIKNAFFKSAKRIVFSVIGLAVIVGSYFFLTRPSYAEKIEGLTIIEGSVRNLTKIKADKVIVYDSELMSKIGEASLKNGSFKWETKDKVPFGEYVLEVNKRRTKIYLSTGDQIHFDIEINEKKSNFSQTGTRKSEAEFSTGRNGFSTNEFEYVVGNKEMNDDPKKFYELGIEAWEDAKEHLKSFRSVENIALSQDYKDFWLQKIAVEMLNDLNDYQKRNSFTDKKYAIPADFKSELLNVIKKPQQVLYTNKDYKRWKINQFLPNKGVKNPDSIILAKLSEMPKSEEKDRLLSMQILKIMKLTDDKTKRATFVESRIGELKNDKYKEFVVNQLMLINAQQKGADFPKFNVVGKDGKTIDLTEEFKDKYIVIDWWATWCGPCLDMKPIFEFEANKYSRSENVVFISISIDDDKKVWEMEVKDEKSKVKQYWLKDKAVKGMLNVNSIPRFMIVDPKGKMYNANLARPGESDFSETMSEFAHNRQIYFGF